MAVLETSKKSVDNAFFDGWVSMTLETKLSVENIFARCGACVMMPPFYFEMREWERPLRQKQFAQYPCKELEGRSHYVNEPCRSGLSTL